MRRSPRQWQQAVLSNYFSAFSASMRSLRYFQYGEQREMIYLSRACR